MKQKVAKITVLLNITTIFIIISCFLTPRTSVRAEDTYTCSGSGISSFYCNFMTDSIKEQYGCTIIKDSSGCSGICTKLTKAAIEKYGPKINMGMDNCTKNNEPTTPKTTTTTKSNVNNTNSNNSSTANVSNDTNQTSNTNISNPQTGTGLIVIIGMIGLIAIAFSILYYKRMQENSDI